MTREQKVNFFQEQILIWFESNARVFAWRANNLSDYEYIIAEVLLQRTRAETVNPFYTKFIQYFPNWQALTNANIEEIEIFLKPVGLFKQRAKRLVNLAKEMTKRAGVLPEDREELESIPFMGQYIANAVELIIFKKPKPLLDVNMARVLERFFGPRKLSDIRYDPYLQALSKEIVKHNKSIELNWAILDFAAKVCTSRNPKCLGCPVNRHCLYYNSQVLP